MRLGWRVERNCAFQLPTRYTALIMPVCRRYFALRQLQPKTSSTYRRARLSRGWLKERLGKEERIMTLYLRRELPESFTANQKGVCK